MFDRLLLLLHVLPGQGDHSEVLSTSLSDRECRVSESGEERVYWSQSRAVNQSPVSILSASCLSSLPGYNRHHHPSNIFIYPVRLIFELFSTGEIDDDLTERTGNDLLPVRPWPADMPDLEQSQTWMIEKWQSNILNIIFDWSHCPSSLLQVPVWGWPEYFPPCHKGPGGWVFSLTGPGWWIVIGMSINDCLTTALQSRNIINR